MSIDARTTDQLTDILNRVAGWPTEVRVSLAQRILHTVEEDLKPKAPRGQRLDRLVGLLKTEGPPPTDEECAAIVEEERMKKYGS